MMHLFDHIFFFNFLLTSTLGLLMQTLSSWATSSVEEVASTGPGIRFFQLYVSVNFFLFFQSTVLF